MPSKGPSPKSPSSGTTPPASRRSARQQRLANREANRALARAGTRGSSGSGGPLLLYTAVFVVIAAIAVGAALYFTNQPKAKQTLHAPAAPVGSAVTPTAIPSNGRTLGNADAPHTIDLWEDFQCPGCRNFTADVEPQVVGNYVMPGKAKMVFHDYIIIDSLAGGTTESLDAANAALCASDQSMFWPYHDWLYANQYSENTGAFTKDRLKTIGSMAGIKDLSQFNSCVDNGDHDADVKNETRPSSVTSTPTIIVDGTAVASADYAAVSAALDKALGVTPSPSTSASPSGSPGPFQSPGSTPAITPSATPSIKPS
ncbi:MAG: thioredoxin domain-containing protein [Candidatus Limnocylindrales bacterium]